MNELLSWKEKKYIYETVCYKFPWLINSVHLTQMTKQTVYGSLGGSDIPISNYAPLSFQAIILFYALDTLQTRLEIKNGNSFNPNLDFKKRLNALPMGNQTQIIFKFCYAIMREIRNEFIHAAPQDSNQKLIVREKFTIPEETIYELFGLIIKYIYLFDGNEFNKYDETIIKQLVKKIYDQLKFDHNENELAKNLKNIFSRLTFDDTFCSWFRKRYIATCKNLQDFKEKLGRQPNYKIPNSYNKLVLNTIDGDEYLIIIGDQKYLIFGSHLDECLAKNDLSEWKLAGNWIGKAEYIQNYENQ
ncbi:Uncharacterised protein [Neisseria zoodegmatis]|uniref:Uncharacterized protein n=1 Tax=Neisseria zoodegmatis TaxID=326523 RepID=A0A378WS60_9NEIS|nr:hypothetical protein [Neisseria zoodegmatis]SUA43969.1 Uncharacterised protein [Neisseria zoodegmatis]